MGLQLTGAAKEDSVANLEVRLPVVVVGGGLTAIDTATEALAYYPVQVEKFLRRYETLSFERGEEAVRQAWTEEERLTADEFIAHARALRNERELARARGAGAAVAAASGWLGRGDRGLSAPAGRLAQLYAEPRGSRARHGGGHPLRRRC